MPQVKSCGECHACCTGALDAEVHGQKIDLGSPCRFLSDTGCAIYNDEPLARPEVCKKFACMWLQHLSLPPSYRPDRAGFILLRRADHAAVIIMRTDFDREAVVEFRAWAKQRNIQVKKVHRMLPQTN